MSGPGATVEYLTLEDLLYLIRVLGIGPVRDLGMLDSACHRPQSVFFGRDAYPSLSAKAAALMHSLARNHALADGNKRIALLATVVFLRLNGYNLEMTDDEAFDLTMAVAAGHLDAAEVEKRLKTTPAPDGPGR